MELELTNGDTFKDPDEESIEASLTNLKGEECAILRRSDKDFIQVVNIPKKGFILECPLDLGSGREHFNCCDGLPLSRVVEAFLSYNRGDEAWRNQFGWRKMTYRRLLPWRAHQAAMLGVIILLIVSFFLPGRTGDVIRSGLVVILLIAFIVTNRQLYGPPRSRGPGGGA